MLVVLSPAKALDFDNVAPVGTNTEVLFNEQAARLVEKLKTLTPQEMASLMGLSEKLALLNTVRYAQWQANPDHASLHKQAVFAFNGNVYEALRAQTLSDRALAFAQTHLCILSGLYGVLRPLDMIQPYRLEMGTALSIGTAKNLYQYWSNAITAYLNTHLEQDTHQKVLVNLASREYFKAVDTKALCAPVVECVFQDCRHGDYKIIGFWAKYARGFMARFILDNALQTVEDLKAFTQMGYAFNAKESTKARFVFQRSMY